MTARSIRAGVLLAAFAASTLWYLLAWAGQTTLDLGARGIALALAAWDGSATRWLAALETVLRSAAAVFDGLLWTALAAGQRRIAADRRLRTLAAATRGMARPEARQPPRATGTWLA